MKIALLTDIHGNKFALDAVLQDLQQHQVDELICLGDLIAIGPHSNEVLHTIMNMDNVKVITGNHDEAVLSLFFNESYPSSHNHARPHHEWVSQQLTNEQAVFLKEQPRQISKMINGNHLLCTHYAYKPGMESTPIAEDPYKRIMEPTLHNMNILFSHYEEDVIAFGHHHPKHDFKSDNKYYINPGALGCNDRNIACYAILDLSSKEVKVEYIKVPYDHTPLLQAYDRFSVPQRDELRRIFHGQGRSD